MIRDSSGNNSLKEYDELLSIWQSHSYGISELECKDLLEIPPLMSALLQNYPCVSWVFYLPTLQFVYFSENSKAILGYEANLIKDGGLEFYNKVLHPDDIQNTWKLLKKSWIYIMGVTPIERIFYKFNYDYRIIKSSGEVVRILSQNAILKQNKQGNVTHILGICNDISGWKKSEKQVASIVSSLDQPVIYLTANDCESALSESILSKREAEIVDLLAQGYSSKYIADKLCISFHTVNTHRQHMLQKTGTKNSGELIQFAISHGVI